MTNSAVVLILLTVLPKHFYLQKCSQPFTEQNLKKNRKIHTDNAGLSHHGNAGKSG